MLRASKGALLVLFTLSALTSVARAQTTNATIVGGVVDQSGAAIGGADITVRNVATGISRELKTDDSGNYRVFPLNPGTYEVTAAARGMKTQIQRNVVLDAAANAKVDFHLDIGVVNETVEVQAAAALLQTQDASVGGTVTGSEVARLPVNGRNYTRLILLLPGTSDQGGSQSNGTFSGTNMISVNGQRRQDNNFTVDGVDNNFMMMNSPGMSPSMDAIQEFRVLDNTSAEFGRSSGSNVNIVIKSGTRDLRGSVYEYLRNDKFDANDFFANKNATGKLPYRQNQYGVAVGGPVIIPKVYHGREKTFWFFNWEGFRERQGQTNISSYPLQTQRNGDFSSLGKPIYDPLTGRLAADGTTVLRTQFPNNIIPANRISPAIKFMLDTMIPLPNRPGITQNFVNTQSLANDRDAINVRGDHNFSTHDSVSFRYSRQRVGQSLPQGNPYLTQVSRFDVDNYMGSWTHIFNPTSVLEVKFGRNVPNLPQPINNTRIQRQDFLTKSGISMFIPDVLFNPIPAFSAGGEWSISSGGQITGDHINQYIANYSKTVGAHTMKVGANYSRRHFSTNTTNPMDGEADFDPSLTNLASNASSGDSFASMLLGYPSQIRRGTGNTVTEAQMNPQSYYVQDDWRVNAKLTVNLGLRYEAIPAPVEDTNRLGNLVIGRSANGAYTGTLLWASVNPEVDPATGKAGEPPHTGGYGPSLMRNNYLDFAPRIGLAYQLTNKTVVRAAYGIFYNSTFVQELQDMRKFWPYTIQQNFSANQGVRPDLLITDAGPSFSNTSAIGGWPQNPDNRTPYSEQWNITVQRQLLNDMTLDVGYVANVNKRQVGYDPINSAVTPGPGPIQPRRLLPAFGDLDGGNNKYNSMYNSLRVNVVKRFSRGIQMNANYTWGRAMTNSSSLAEATVQNPYNLRQEWSRASIDLRHIFQLSYVYELPFGHNKHFGSNWNGVTDAFLGGWSAEGITRAQTGAPLNPRINQDRANVGRTYQRPNATGLDPNAGPKTPDAWFNVAAFALPAPFTYGTSGAFVINAPGRYNWDLAMQKDFRFLERQSVQFRAEAFNLPNSVSMQNPDTTFDGNHFGQVTAATPARIIQFALRYSF